MARLLEARSLILVFGGKGQLGSALVEAGAAAGVPVVGMDRAEADITNPRSVAAAIDRVAPSVLVNAAAFTGVDAAEGEAEAAWRINAEGPRVIAEAAAGRDLPLVHVSTDYVFDGSKVGPYCEDDPVAPIGEYGRSKAAGEDEIRCRTPRHLILRTAWLYSARGRNFLTTMLRLAASRPELRVVADQIGSPTAASDLAAAIVAVAPRLTEEGASHGTFHVAGQGAVSWHGFASRIVERQAEFTGKAPPVTPIGTADYLLPARRPVNSVLDSGLFARTYGITLPDWRDAVDRTINDAFNIGAEA